MVSDNLFYHFTNNYLLLTQIQEIFLNTCMSINVIKIIFDTNNESL